MVIVNTVVLVKARLGLEAPEVALALAAFGGGSMLAAMALPRLLERTSDRAVMIAAAILLASLTVAHGVWMLVGGLPAWLAFLTAWALSGMLYSSILTPSGRLLRRSAHAEDRPAVFAAQFALSHACWLLTYPIAGWAGEALGLPATMVLLGAVALVGVGLAARVWPAGDPEEIAHAHPDLPADHPHLREHRVSDAWHQHVFVIDDEHRVWPTQG
jgi:predicted MFS family arabinose efflux permease